MVWCGERNGRTLINDVSLESLPPTECIFVVSKACPLLKAAANLAGADIVPVNSLNAELLAPGTHSGRITLYTDSALDVLAQTQLFIDKKTVGGKVFFVLPTRIGQVAVTDQVAEDDIDAVLNW